MRASGRSFTWKFIIACVKQPIFGSDFLRHFDILVDVKKGEVVQKKTQVDYGAVLSKDVEINQSHVATDFSFECRKILEDFEDI